VSVTDSKVFISVGLECPDTALDNVVKVFNLGYYMVNNHVRVYKNAHWDSVSHGGY
jgi:hypothetical protein